jgi:hypothetical protein
MNVIWIEDNNGWRYRQKVWSTPQQITKMLALAILVGLMDVAMQESVLAMVSSSDLE